MVDEQRKIIRFYGASDDLVEVDNETAGWSEEYNVYPEPTSDKAVWSVTTQVDDHIEGMRVRAIYDGVWSFSVGPLFFDHNYDEPQPFPDWPIRFRMGDPAPKYSIVLEIEAPMFTAVSEAVS